MFRHESHPYQDLQGGQDSHKIGHGITSSDRMVWYNVGQILLGSGKCLANCMNTYSLALLMSRISTTALCMPFR